MVSGPRPEMTYRKPSWEKLTLKSPWFRSFSPFLEFIVYLHWRNVWNTNAILSTSVNILFRISSKRSAHRTAEQH
jgi:hypothetical protein